MIYLAGFLFFALAGLGVGGGGLLVIYLTGVMGMEQRSAQGLNLCFFIIASIFSLFYYVGRRRINYPLVIFAGVIGAVFSVFGSYLAASLPSYTLRRLFGIFMAVAGSVSLVKTFRQRRKK